MRISRNGQSNGGMKPLINKHERESVTEALAAFIRSDRFSEALNDALVDFFGRALFDKPPQERRRAIDCEICGIGLFMYFLWDYKLENGKTIVDMFLAQEHTRLSSGERSYIERMRASRMGLYEIAEVKLDQGVTLVDLLSGERLRVRERLATHQLQRLEVIGARLMRETDDQLVFDGGLYTFNPTLGEQARALLASYFEMYRKEHPNADQASFLKHEGAALINQYWVHHVFFAPAPKLFTFDGEELVLCDMSFDVHDAAALRRALDNHERISPESENAWLWFKPQEPDSERVIFLATMRLRGKKLKVETKSRERAERIRELLSSLAGDAVTFRTISTQSAEEIAQSLQAQPQAAELKTRRKPTRRQRRMEETALSKHYERWPDTKLPVLENITPREAVQRKDQRPKVALLLKDLEYNMESRRMAGEAAVDLAWIRKELGIEPDEPTASLSTLTGSYTAEDEPKAESIMIESLGEPE